MKVIGYVRVSREEQATSGVSLKAHAEKIRMYGQLHDLDLVGIESDPGFSASSLDRPGIARVLAMLDDGSVEGVVIFKLDRLTRNLGDWTMLIDRYFSEKGGRILMSVTESVDTRTANGRMALNIMMTLAMWERETIVERTVLAMAYKKSKGERVGTVPYGWDLGPDGRVLVPNPREQAALGLIREKHALNWTLRAIAAELDRAGYPPKRGAGWNHTSVRAILKRHQSESAA